MRINPVTALFAAVILCSGNPSAAQDDWVEKSNQHARIVLESVARFNPETAGSIGVDGLDEEILDLREGLYERGLADSERVLGELRIRHAEESHPAVRQDKFSLPEQDLFRDRAELIAHACALQEKKIAYVDRDLRAASIGASP